MRPNRPLYNNNICCQRPDQSIYSLHYAFKDAQAWFQQTLLCFSREREKIKSQRILLANKIVMKIALNLEAKKIKRSIQLDTTPHVERSI